MVHGVPRVGHDLEAKPPPPPPPNNSIKGLPWWSSGQDSTLPKQGAWDKFLVAELRSYVSQPKIKTKKQTNMGKGTINYFKKPQFKDKD